MPKQSAKITVITEVISWDPCWIFVTPAVRSALLIDWLWCPDPDQPWTPESIRVVPDTECRSALRAFMVVF